MIRKRKRRKSNQGNSFIIVIATVSFLAVLTAALLVAVGLCFRLKAYDINSRDNFYYLEQAMDEIYEGVGSIVMKDLNEAYDETAAVLVYFDPVAKSYVTMNNQDASNLMKATFVHKLQKNSALSATGIGSTLQSVITYAYDASSRPDGVQFSVGNVVSDENGLVIKDLVLKREAEYSTLNTSKSRKAKPATFIQSITADLTIAKPNYEVNFDFTDNNMSNLYGFALISDMGVEINGITTKSNIVGNVYAAADFYNKKYNQSTVTGLTKENAESRKKALNNKICSYSNDKLKDCDGLQEKSMYSGFYVNGADVSILADRMIVPGSIAAMNCGKLNINGNIDAAKVWADGIVLGGYSRQKNSSSGFEGSKLDMTADVYIYDDLEVNAAGSDFTLDGNYFGYNYAATDNREYSEGFNLVSGNRKFAHYNSSAVIVNGENASLDLSNVDSMYIAGQAYVEFSKKSVAKSYKVTGEGSELTTEEIPEEDKNQDDDQIVKDTFEYVEQDDDNYMRRNGSTDKAIQDYRTGESLSIKSNQLAYISLSSLKDDNNGNLYINVPSEMLAESFFQEYWPDVKKNGIPVIETVVSGNKYYFYDFSNAKKGANEFIAEYAKLFNLNEGEQHSVGEQAGLLDITNYQAFKVGNVTKVDNIYSNSAISFKEGSTSTIKISADSTNVLEPLREANKALDNAVGEPAEGSNPTVYANNVTAGLQNQYKEMKMLLADKSADADPDAVAEAYAAEESGITPINYYFNFNCLNGDGLEYLDNKDIQKHIKFSNLGVGSRRDPASSVDGSNFWKYEMDYNKTNSCWIYLGTDNIEIKPDPGRTDGKVQGLVICKGDVTIDPGVKEFEGLIVAGGKVMTNHSVDFIANEALVKFILRECDDSRLAGKSKENISAVCQLFRHFDSNYEGKPVTPADDAEALPTPDDIEPMKNISSVLYEDIVAFKNWKKNVD